MVFERAALTGTSVLSLENVSASPLIMIHMEWAWHDSADCVLKWRTGLPCMLVCLRRCCHPVVGRQNFQLFNHNNLMTSFWGWRESGSYLCRCRWHTAEACSCRCCWSSDCGGWGWKILGSWRPRCLQQGPWRGLVAWRSGKKRGQLMPGQIKSSNPNQCTNSHVSWVYFI